jgi:cation diffusion facilitator CzcD-associated flavoprotein CzcO
VSDLARNGSTSRSPRVAIIGAGMSGLCMGIKLRQAGMYDFVIYEKADRVGGTWRENTYPGLSCDVPSRSYAFSFEPNPDWSTMFPGGPEIFEYFDRVADKYGLRRHIRFGETVHGGTWEDGRWTVRTTSGEERFDFFVSGAGILHRWRMPDIPGLDTFAGPKWHSAAWDHSVPLEDKRVGLVGTGSTGVQITTALSGNVGHLDVFQRTPQWVLPLPNHRSSRATRELLRRVPPINRLAHRAWLAYLEQSFGVGVIRPGWRRSLLQGACRQHLRLVGDPELRRRLTPDYQPMCKRIVMNYGFYQAIQHPQTTLVDTPIERVEAQGIRTTDGVLHELDVLALATGFDGTAYGRPLELVGEGGLTLDEAWRDGPRGYLTVALPAFPNYFALVGPHSPFGNHSVMAISEAQTDFVMGWLERFRTGQIDAVAPTAQATDRFNEAMDRAMPDTVWVTGCKSWYMNDRGQPVLWPWTPARHREMLATAPMADFVVD